jgi:fibro-slime domain-containing protein
MKKAIFLLCSILLLAFQLKAQQYPQTIYIPVTFYDFHADGSNPDFERPGGGLRTGEVADTLDAERKPVVGPRPYYSQYVHKWFRPWQSGDFNIPVYDANGAYLKDSTVNYDTAYKNIVFKDSLPFTYRPDLGYGVYQYSNQSFFLLDNKGFGADDPGGQNPPHNFGFTMELHWTFTYQPGLIFEFEGDDDVWVFINGRKVIDLGGIHGATRAAVNLDTLRGMELGKKYNFDLFYAERHVVASDILITTNLFTPPGYLQLFSKPDAPGPNNPSLGPKDTANAGEPFSIYAHVFDSLYNWMPSKDALVTWTMTDQQGNPIISSQQGPSISYTATDAFGNVNIVATFTDPETKKVITASLSMYIAPGAAHHIVIEADSLARNTRDDRPVGTITVSRTSGATVYAVVRDQYGNFVRFANNAVWTVENPQIASATPLSGNQKAARISQISFGSTMLTASEGNLIPGQAKIECISPNTAVPVTATLLDVNGNGFLDRIDIVLPDSVALGSVLPTVSQLIQSMNIISTDGGKNVTLNASSLSASGTRTIQIILTENTGTTLETGWTSATIKLSNVNVTADARPIYVDKIIDGAEPVVKSVCFIPTSTSDSLYVFFSEPLINATKPINEYNILTVKHTNGSLVPISSTTVSVIKLDDIYIYIFGKNTLSTLDSVKAGVRAFNLDLCGDVSVVVDTRIIGNPFIPGQTVVPVTGPNDLRIGTKIEVSLLPAIIASLASGKIKGTVTIFDAVGNTVVEKAEMLPDFDNVKLNWVWNGKTKKGTIASPGTYFVRGVVEDLERGRKNSFKCYVGIKR